MSLTAPEAGPELEVGGATVPVVPILMIVIGGYLTWFALHYWRDQHTHWPTDPVKDLLQGKAMPVPDREQSIAEDVSGAGQLAASSAAGAGNFGVSASGGAVARDAEKYVGKVPYKWGGANPKGWECSGLCNYVICHDAGLDIPGYAGGTFDGSTHGPTVGEWITWPSVDVIDGLSKAEPGDLIAFGPDVHMGIAVSSTEFVNAADPKQGTIKSSISGDAGLGVPFVLRMKDLQSTGGGKGALQGIARLQFARFPFNSKANWNALIKLWGAEDKWSATARNPGSGAYGVAQALGHGGSNTAGTDGINEYGAEYGLSPDQARQANSGNGLYQIIWGLGYIESRYGTPLNAWAHEKANGWY